MTARKKEGLLLESTTCGRCGGSGSYSWCQRYGSTCFGCGGRGVVLTKRGRAAQNFLNNQAMVRADSLVVGDLYRCTSMTVGGDAYTYFARIVGIERNGDSLVLVGESKYQNSRDTMASDSLVFKGRTGEEVRAYRALAVEFQSRLYKNGRVKVLDLRV